MSTKQDDKDVPIGNEGGAMDALFASLEEDVQGGKSKDLKDDDEEDFDDKPDKKVKAKKSEKKKSDEDDPDFDPGVEDDEQGKPKKVEKKKSEKDDDDQDQDWLKEALDDEENDDEEKEEEEDDKPAAKIKKPAVAVSTDADDEVVKTAKSKAELYDKLMSDEGVKLLLAAQAEKKSIFDMVSDIVKLDPKNYDDDTLLTMRLKDLGVKDADLDKTLAEVSSIEALRMIDEQRKILSGLMTDKLKSLPAVKLETDTEKANKDLEKRTKLGQKLEKALSENKDKFFRDTTIKLTDEVIRDLKGFFSKGGKLIGEDSDGILDADELIEFALYKKYKKLQRSNLAKQVRNYILDKEFRKIEGSTASRSMGGASGKTKKQSKEKELDDLTENIAKSMGVTFIK